VTVVLKQKFLTKYTALLSVEMKLPSKRLLKDISFQGLVEELEKLESARSVSKTCQYTMTNRFAASA
jgi:hypothetical protein